MICCIANIIGFRYAANIPSEMLAPQDRGEAQEEVKVIIYVDFLLQLAFFYQLTSVTCFCP